MKNKDIISYQINQLQTYKQYLIKQQQKGIHRTAKKLKIKTRDKLR